MNHAPTDGVSAYATALQALEGDDRLRSLKPRAGIDFSSNDYLGARQLDAHEKRAYRRRSRPAPRSGPAGRGCCAAIARSTKVSRPRPRNSSARKPRYSSEAGYVANFAVLTTLPQRGDLLVLDSLVHASIHEGARAGRADVPRKPA